MIKKTNNRQLRSRVEAVLGIQGVHPSENALARKVGKFFSLLVNFSLILVLLQLVAMWMFPRLEQHLQWVDEWVWFVFASEFLTSIFLVDRRWRYLRNNWLNLSIVILAAPLFKWDNDWLVILRAMRLVLVIRVVFNLFDVVVKVLTKNSFGTFLLVSIVFLLVSAVIFSYIEGINFGDALWYALVTITTVGYGDVVPKTENGREFGALMILFGVVLFSIVTANISAFLVGEEQERTEHDILNYVKQVHNRLLAQEKNDEAQIERILTHITLKVDELAERMKKSDEIRLQEGLKSLETTLHNARESRDEKLFMELHRLEQRIDRLEQNQNKEVIEKLEKIEKKVAHL